MKQKYMGDSLEGRNLMKEWFSRRMNELQDLRKAKSLDAARRHWREAKRPLEEGARRLRGR